MHKNVVIALVLSLSGCASTETVLNGPVSQTFHSTDSATKVSFCLANKNNTAALDRDDGAKVVLIKNGYGGASWPSRFIPRALVVRSNITKKFGTIGGIWRKCIGPEAERAEAVPVGIAPLRS